MTASRASDVGIGGESPVLSKAEAIRQELKQRGKLGSSTTVQKRFEMIQGKDYVFPFGRDRDYDKTRPVTTF